MTDFNKTVHLKVVVDVDTNNADKAVDALSRRISGRSGSGSSRRPLYAPDNNPAHLTSGDPYIFGASHTGYKSEQSYQQSVTRSSNYSRNLSDSINRLNSELKNVNSANRNVSAIATRTQNRGHLTYADSRGLAGSSNVISETRRSMSTDSNGNPGELLKQFNTAATKRNQLEDEYKRLISSNASKEQVDDTRRQIEEINKLVSTYDKLNTAVHNASGNAQTAQGVASGYTVDPQRGSLAYNVQQRAYSIGANLIGAATQPVRSMYQTGFQINQATGAQALQVGQLIGGLSDTAIRKSAQNISLHGGYGYDTQTGLDFYSDAIQRRGSVLSSTQAGRYVNNIEQAGRASNLSDTTYKSLVSTLSGGGALNKESDIKSIVSSVMAANQMSGNAGNYEQNTNTLTALIGQIASNRQVTATSAKNTASDVSLLQHGNSALQGTAGATQLQNINSSFTSASQGGNNALLYTIFRANGETGAKGLWDAKLQAEQGLSNPKNITSVRDMFSRQARAGGQQQAIAASNIQKMLNISASAANGIAKDIASGKYSDAEIASRAQKAQEQAQKDYNKGLSGYNGSEQKDLNTSITEKETNASKLKSSTNWVTQLGNFMNSNPIGELLTATGGSILGSGAMSLGAAGISKLIKGRAITSLLSKGGLSGLSSLFTGASTGLEDTSLFSRLSTGATTLWDGATGLGKGLFSKASSGLSGIVSKLAGVGEGASAASSSTGLFSKLLGGGSKVLGLGSKFLGKIAAPIAAFQGAQGIGDIMKDPGNAFMHPIKSIGSLLGLSRVNADKTGSLRDFIDPDKKKSSKKSSSKKSSSKSGYSTSKSQIEDRESKSLLAKENSIVDKRLEYLKEYKALLPDKTTNSSSKSSSKSHKAFGGIVTQRTEIAEGNRSEYVVPLDPAKSNYTKDALNQIQGLTGIHASDGKQIVTNRGNYAPNITINATGEQSTRFAEDLQHKISQAMQNASSNYRNNMQTI